LKILVCASEYPPFASGIGSVAYRMVREFEKKGHQCTICSPTGPDIRLGSYKMIRKPGGLGILYFWWCVDRYFTGKASQWDAVWLHWPMFLRRCPFPKAVVTFHGTYRGYRDMANDMHSSLFSRKYYTIMELAERCYLSHLSSCVFTAVSSRTAEELHSQGVSAKDISYIPVGADTERFHPMQELKAGIDAPVFLYFGRLARQKNLFRLVDTFVEVKNSLPHAILLIAGSGELEKPLTRYVGEKPDINLLGFIPNEELPQLCAKSDFFIIASKYEGQPVALIEAMAAGLPPIVNNIPVLKQIVEESGAGIVVDFDNPVLAAEQIETYVFINPKGQLDRKTAREYVVGNMSSAMCAEKYLDLMH